jgi:stage V sporulation protein G
MQVTSVQIRLTGGDVVKAYVGIVLDDCWMIHGLKLIRHSAGYLVAMPQTKRGKGKPYDAACPITREARRMIEDAVMAEYRKVAAEPAGSTGDKNSLNAACKFR